MSFYSLALAPVLLAAVSSGRCAPQIIEPAANRTALCSAPLPGTYAVIPFGNPNGFKLDLGGTEELLMNQLQSTGCYTLLERDQLQVLLAELSLCSDKNPDRDAFDCDSFAERGKLLGVTNYVMGSVVIMEQNVRGVELSAKIKGVAGIEAKRTYDALGVTMRVVDVETGKIGATTTVHAVVRSRGGGFSAKKGPVQVSAIAKDKTAAGRALDEMFWTGACRLAGGKTC